MSEDDALLTIQMLHVHNNFTDMKWKKNLLRLQIEFILNGLVRGSQRASFSYNFWHYSFISRYFSNKNPYEDM